MGDAGRGRSEIKESAGPHIARAQRRAAEFVSRYDRLSARRPLWTVPREFARTYRRLNCSLLAGAIAFRTFLWLMPFALFAVGVLSAFGAGGGGLKIAHHLGFTGAAADQIRDALHDGHKSWYVAALIGLLGVATSGLSLIRNIYLAYGRIWDLEPRPLRRRLRTLTALIGGSPRCSPFVGSSATSETSVRSPRSPLSPSSSSSSPPCGCGSLGGYPTPRWTGATSSRARC